MSNRSSRVRQSLKAKTAAAKGAAVHARAEATRYRESDEMHRSLLAEQGSRMRRLEGVLEDALHEASTMCSLFPPERSLKGSRHDFSPRSPTYRLPGGPLLSPPVVLTDAVPGDMKMTFLDLPMMMMRCREAGFLDDKVHVELNFEDKTSAYAISHSALRSMSPKRLEQTIEKVFMPELARHLVRQVRR